jgi:hypothetical protein
MVLLLLLLLAHNVLVCDVAASPGRAYPSTTDRANPTATLFVSAATTSGFSAEKLDRLAAWHEERSTPRYALGDLVADITRDDTIPREAKIRVFMKFLDTHSDSRGVVLNELTTWKVSAFAIWLRHHGSELTVNNWTQIANTLITQHISRNTWQDPDLILALRAQVSSQNDGIRGQALGSLGIAGRVEDVLALIPMLDSEASHSYRSIIYEAQTRFDHPKANALTHKLLAEYKEPDVIGSILDYGLAQNHRHDFLPDLKRLRARLAATTDLLQKEPAERMIVDIDAAIEKLEADKQAGVPIGEKLESP